MRLSYLLELVLAVCVGLGLARYRLTGPELAEFLPGQSRIPWFEEGIDSVLAGMALVGGLGTLIERARGRSPATWGPGRWAWAFLAIYLTLHLLDWITDILSAHNQIASTQNSPWEDIVRALRGKYSGFLLPATPWFVMALGLTSLATTTRRDPSPDTREWAGRTFAALLVAIAIGSKALLLLGIKEYGGMGGG